jgi:hypothetical protein
VGQKQVITWGSNEDAFNCCAYIIAYLRDIDDNYIFINSFVSQEGLRYVSNCRLGVSVKVPVIPE